MPSSTKVSTPLYLLQLMDLGRSPRNLRIGPEARECIKLANELRGLTLEGALDCIWLHIGNEGKRSPMAGHLLKAMGLLSGAPDYVFIRPQHTLLVEMKTKGAYQTPTQRAFERWATGCGIGYLVCRSTEEVLSQLKALGFFV